MYPTAEALEEFIQASILEEDMEGIFSGTASKRQKSVIYERSDEHTMCRDWTMGEISVKKLISATSNRRVEQVKVDCLRIFLSKKIWEEEEGQMLSPADLIENRMAYPKHWMRMVNAEMQYPILVWWPEGKAYPADILDGMHRLAWACMNGIDTIKVRRVYQEDIDKARISSSSSSSKTQ